MCSAAESPKAAHDELLARAYQALRALPENERHAFVAAIEARAAEWRNCRARGNPAVWPIVVNVQQDSRVQAERY